MSGLSRRQFVQSAAVAGIGLVAGCGRLPGQAAAPPPMHRIGVLFPGSPSVQGSWYEDFRHALRDLGHVEGQNTTLEVRYAEGQSARLPELVGELLAAPVDVIVANSLVVARVVKPATTTIPIVVITGDPVGAGLVSSYAHPGGNITGLSNIAPELAAKRLELLKEAVPGITRVAVIWNQADQTMALEFGETIRAAEELGVELQSLAAREQSGLERAYDAAVAGGADGIVVIADEFIVRSRSQIVALSARSRLPTISGDRDFAQAGGLMAYGPNRRELEYGAAYLVDKILKGAKPADLPIERPMRFDFVVNLKTAQELGITFPQETMMQVTEVIQ